MSWFRNVLHREPVVMWSCIIGGAGLLMPVVVPPIRETLGFKSKNYGAPPVRKMIEESLAKE